MYIWVFFQNYKEILETIKHPLYQKLNEATTKGLQTEGLGIYFPGTYENRITTSTYHLPFSCTIFFVVEMFG